jgi:SAM-dependent methyltransferase
MNEQTNEGDWPESATAEATPNPSLQNTSSSDDARESGAVLEELARGTGTGERDDGRGATPDRRSSSLLLKLALGAAATFSLLGGALAFQQPRAARQPPQRRPASAQATARDADRIDRPVSEPYTGSLSIFEDPKRDEKLQIQRVMDVLRIREGSGVADIGAGSGWFTVRAARRVGASGAVYAVEINPEYVAHIERRAKEENLPQARAVLGKEDDPLLPAESADAVLLLKTYHEVAEPVRLLRNLRKSLRRGALVGVIDREGKGDDHGLDAAKVIAEADRAGYALVGRHDFVKPDGMDYFLVFNVKE